MRRTPLNADAVPSQQPRQAPPGTAPSVLLGAAWFAVAGGLIEATWHAFRWLVLGEVVKLSPHFVWMAPLANLILFVVPGLGLFLLHRVAPRAVTRARAAGLFAFLATLGVLSMFPGLHRIAMLIVALGVAVQAGRWIAAMPASARALMRATLVWMMAGAVTAGAARVLGQHLRERRALAAVGDAPAGAPNVLLLILDTVRAASLALYGYDRPTSPNLEAFAHTGIVFNRALSASPWTLPSHSTMFTGQYAHVLSANWETPLDAEHPTIAAVLATQGWVTAGFVANLFYADRPNGLARGFVHYEDYRVSIGEIMNTSSLGALLLAGRPGLTFNPLRNLIDNHAIFGFKDAYRVNADLLDWLDQRPDGQPFFAFLNYNDAHYPYVSPPDLRETFGVRERWTYNANAYDAAVASTDRAVGQLVDSLRARELLDNTIIVIAADHGEHLGEKDRTGHGNSLYMENLHVPLLISYPGGPADMRVNEFVSLRSLAATILDLAGAPDNGGIPGTSLRAAWGRRGDTVANDFAAIGERLEEGWTRDPVLASVRRSIRTNEELPIAKGDLHSLVEDGFQFIRNGDDTEELYDLRSDMSQDHDLIGAGTVASVLSRLRDRISSLVPAMRAVPGERAEADR
ncbi:MAG: sulfatase-like hydrolase/transferase [Longimicrobiales bacterium]